MNIGGMTWKQVKKRLEEETDYKIKPYDDDLDFVLNLTAMPITSEIELYELYDDWDDNKLSGRAKKLKMKNSKVVFAYKFRPEWSVVSGTPTVSNGRLYLDNDSQLQIPSDFAVGTWRFKFEWTDSAAADTSQCRIKFMYVDADNAYYFQTDAVLSSSHNGLKKIVGGSITDLIMFGVDLGEHTIKITRDSSGNFEIFYDGASQGTTTDTDITSTNYFNIWYNQNPTGKLFLDELEVF